MLDEELRRSWQRYLDHHGPRPDEPAAIAPRVFLGRAQVSGTTLEVRRAHGAHEVWADGVLSDRLDAERDFADAQPGLRYRWNDNDYDEVFAASDESLTALVDFLDATEASPPWDEAAELLADGLIDVHFDLTPRGRRATAQWR